MIYPISLRYSPRTFRSSSKFSEDFIVHFPEKSAVFRSMVMLPVWDFFTDDELKWLLRPSVLSVNRSAQQSPLSASASPMIGWHLVCVRCWSTHYRRWWQSGTFPLIPNLPSTSVSPVENERGAERALKLKSDCLTSEAGRHTFCVALRKLLFF